MLFLRLIQWLYCDIPSTFIIHVPTELNPVCAIVGGLLAQDILNALSQSGRPINNLLVFDTDKCSFQVLTNVLFF